MFWTNYQFLCSQVEKAPSAVAAELNITSGTVTGWKRGVLPSKKSLEKIAEYFGVPVSDLLGQTIAPPGEAGGSGKNDFVVREDLRDNYAFRILYETLEGATDADMLEAAANIARRKEERYKQ